MSLPTTLCPSERAVAVLCGLATVSTSWLPVDHLNSPNSHWIPSRSLFPSTNARIFFDFRLKAKSFGCLGSHPPRPRNRDRGCRPKVSCYSPCHRASSSKWIQCEIPPDLATDVPCHSRPIRYLAVAQWDRPDLEGSQFHACQMDLLSWRQSINPALECTEENAFTRIEMGQLTTFFARESELELGTTRPITPLYETNPITLAVHLRFHWAMGTLCGVVLRQPLDMSNSALSVWQQQTMLTYQQSWNAISDAAAVILDVEPDFVPEDPICEPSQPLRLVASLLNTMYRLCTVIDLLADALDAQLSIAIAVTASPSQARIQNLLTIMSRLAGLFPGSKATVSHPNFADAFSQRLTYLHLSLIAGGTSRAPRSHARSPFGHGHDTSSSRQCRSDPSRPRVVLDLAVGGPACGKCPVSYAHRPSSARTSGKHRFSSRVHARRCTLL